ncbi:MAG TPA: hypothetical protein VNA25_06985, partial [Phycisphaerae bacterium]|nr:hypothetical protein [Phycisphaerae bacterium]
PVACSLPPWGSGRQVRPSARQVVVCLHHAAPRPATTAAARLPNRPVKHDSVQAGPVDSGKGGVKVGSRGFARRAAWSARPYFAAKRCLAE